MKKEPTVFIVFKIKDGCAPIFQCCCATNKRSKEYVKYLEELDRDYEYENDCKRDFSSYYRIEEVSIKS